MVAMKQGGTDQRGVWSKVWDGTGGLTCRSERLRVRQRYLGARMSWKVLQEGCESISTIFRGSL